MQQQVTCSKNVIRLTKSQQEQEKNEYKKKHPSAEKQEGPHKQKQQKQNSLHLVFQCGNSAFCFREQNYSN